MILPMFLVKILLFAKTRGILVKLATELIAKPLEKSKTKEVLTSAVDLHYFNTI